MPTDDKPIDKWTANHFAQANPTGDGQGDVPALLRRVADTIAGLGDVQILDLLMHVEVTAEGDWPSLVVYYHRPDRESHIDTDA
jgi:hypothetical protein